MRLPAEVRNWTAAIAAVLLAAAVLPVRAGELPPTTHLAPPGMTESSVGRFVAGLLQSTHFSKRRFDDEASSKFLDRYLEALDASHSYFTKGDLDEFEKYRRKLDELTFAGDTTPSRVIFERFLQRVEQRVSYVTNLVKTAKFEFDAIERYTPNRKELPNPKDLPEAKDLWTRQVRFEYLQEKLGKPSVTNASARIKDVVVDKEGRTNKVEKTAPLTPGQLAKKQHEDIVKALTARYSRFQRNIRELSEDEVFGIYLTSLAHVFDPHSDYMTDSQLKNFEIAMKLSLYGIGALLQQDDDYVKIVELHPGPAARSQKIKPGDKIVSVGQGDKGEYVEVGGMKLQKVVEMIRGEKGSKVRLNILPGDSADSSVRKEVTLLRDEIKLEDSEAKARVYDQVDARGKTNRIGLIDLPSFYADFQLTGATRGEQKSTTKDVSKLITKLKAEGMNGLILDLRRNGGGSLEEAINLTGLFIKKGPVVQVKDPSGQVFVDEDPDESVLYDGPLMVLTSRFSASASEIVAAALQDYGRALLVGDRTTHGKGTVQQLLPLDKMMGRSKDYPVTSNPGALKLTIRKFYRANGASTQLKGVMPDIILPSVNNHAELGEASLDDPLPWDVIKASVYEPLNEISALVFDLKSKSEQRVASSREFELVRDDIARYQKIIKDKSVSMNQAERLKEREENKKRDEARKAERLNHRNDPKFFEVTLRNSVEAGLQFWQPKTNQVARIQDPDDDVDPADAELEKLPALDIHLDEAKNIMVDLIQAVAKGKAGMAVSK